MCMHTNAAWVYIWCAQNHKIKISFAHIHAHKYPYMQLSIHRGFFILFIYHSLKEEYPPIIYIYSFSFWLRLRSVGVKHTQQMNSVMQVCMFVYDYVDEGVQV